MTRNRRPLFRARALAGILVFAWALTLADGAGAWSNHALLTWPALSALPEVAALPPVRVETLADFLAAESAGLARLLQDEEAWARRNVPGHAPLPPGSSYRADASSAQERLQRFVAAVRINPASRLGLFLQLPAGRDPAGRPQLKESDVTLLATGEATKLDTFVALREGEMVPVIDVVATASDEPDYGLDIGLWSDSGTPHGERYGFGTQPFGNPAIEYSSQGPMHMGYFHESAIVYKAAPFLSRTFPEYRIHLWRSLASFALRRGHRYWGWRFAGWGLHYLQDLTQPYHARVLPGVGVTRMLWINTLDLVGLHGSKREAITFVTNRHLALENFEWHWIRAASLTERADDAGLQALRDASNDPPLAYADDWPRQRTSRQAFDAADGIDDALVAWLPAKATSDPAYVFGVTEPDVDLYAGTASRPQARAALMHAITPLLANAGRNSRAFVRGLLAD